VSDATWQLQLCVIITASRVLSHGSLERACLATVDILLPLAGGRRTAPSHPSTEGHPVLYGALASAGTSPERKFRFF
jgi:hypothetical protein